MTEKSLRVILWVVFTALFFAIFCGVSYLISGKVDIPTAVLFFVVIGIADQRGIGYLVDYYVEKKGFESDDSSK